MPDEALLLEAERRGILPPDKAAALDEARKRGLISDPTAPQDQTDQSTGEKMQIDVGGGKIEVPKGISQEGLQKAIADFRTTPEFDKLVDKERGAPARVRTLVGSSLTPEDKIANLRRFYPDAQPYGSDNFVFTDPATGRPTLYNPEGLDVGDVASVLREGSQALFATGGAVAGAQIGAAGGLLGGPAAPGTVPLGASAGAAFGAGAGNVAGGVIFDALANTFMDRIDTRTPLEGVRDASVDFVFGAAGQRAGELISVGAKAALTKGRGFASAMASKFRSLGIEPPAGAVTGSKTLQGLEKSIEGTIAGGDVLQKQAETVVSQTKAAAENVAAKFGQAQERAGAGQTIKRAAEGVLERFGFKQAALYDDAFAKVGDETFVPMKSVMALRQQMEQELALAPQSLKQALQPAIRMLQSIEADAVAEGSNAGLMRTMARTAGQATDEFQGLPFVALRQIRTMIGRDIKQPAIGKTSGATQAALKRIYGALTEDMSAAAQQAGPDAASALKRADRYTRIFMDKSKALMDKITRFDADERAFDFLMQSSRDNARALSRLRGHFLPEEWDTVAATTLHRMGQARAGAQDAAGEAFSVNTFLTNWNRLSPEAKKIMFSGKRYGELAGELDNLVTVIGALKDTEKLANHSNTAKAMVTYMTLQALGGAAAGLAIGGDPQSAGIGVAAVFAPRFAAKLITSPRFVKWLTTDVAPGALGPHIGRLLAIAEAEPEIRDEIEQYVQALRSIPESKTR